MSVRIVFINKHWYFETKCDNVDTESVAHAIEKFADEANVVSLPLDNGTRIIMPKDIVEETSFFVEES